MDKKKENNLPKNEDGSIKAGPGRPPGAKNKPKYTPHDFKDAMRYVEENEGKHFLVHLIEQAFKDKRVLVALAKKILPDLKATDLAISGSEEFKEWLNELSEGSEGRRKLPSDSDD